MWALIKRIARNDNQREISLFDVKELYDAAYDEKAEQMDLAYRAQLGLIVATRYEKAA